MPVAYPTNLRLPLRASKSRSQPAAFNYDRPRRGTGYARPIGSNVPVFWTLTWRLTEAEAVTFLRWFTHDLDRGRLEFALPVRTEFGLSDYTCLLLPDDLMTAREEGALWTYTATVMARELVVPEPPPSICLDGPVWTTQSASGLGMNALGSCAFFQGYFYLFGRYTSGSTVAVFRSITGETGSWEAVTVPANSTTVVFGARAVAGSTRMLWNFQTGGTNGTRQTLDGTTWETVLYSDTRQIHVMNTAGFERVIRSQASARPVGMYSSVNMTAAARLVAPLGTPSFDQDQAGLSTTSWPASNTQLAFANNGDQVLALINPSSGSPTRLFISEDGGFVWTEPTISASWGANALSVESLIHDGSRYIATSRDHNQPTHSSVDGYTWQEDSVLPVKVGQLNRALYHFDGMTYAVGLGGAGAGPKEVYGTPNPATTPWYLLPNQVGQTGDITYHHWASNGAGRFMAVAPGSTSLDYRLGLC